MVKPLHRIFIGLALSLQGLGATASALPVYSPTEQDPFDFFNGIEIEELVNTEISELVSIAKRRQDIKEAPAAATIITREEIRRSGATSVPDILRMVPGFHVARLASSSWNVASRGLGGIVLNKLLVIVDGRTIYDPALGGVFWDIHLPTVDIIRRVEVIRGPGSVLWGANAVNGIVNITTLDSKRSVGTRISAGGGNEDQLITSLSHGTRWSDNLTSAVHAGFNIRDDLRSSAGGNGNDNFDSGQFTARMDHHGDNDIINLISGMTWSQGKRGITSVVPGNPPSLVGDPNPFESTLAYGVAKWTRILDSGSDYNLQLFFEHLNQQTYEDVDTQRNTYDIDFYSSLYDLAGGQNLVWGFGARFLQQDAVSSPTLSFRADEKNWGIYNFFLQDEIPLSDKLAITLGSKFSYNDFTKFEYQPGIRLGYKYTPETFMWSAITRAVRIPSRFEQEGSLISSALPLEIEGLFDGQVLLPNQNLESEDLLSYELGARTQATENLHLDLVLYYSRYTSLTAASLSNRIPQGIPGGLNLIPLEFNNEGQAESYGAELQVKYNATATWSLIGTYTFVRDSFSFNVPNAASPEISSPEHVAILRSLLDVSENWELDTTLRYSDSVSVPVDFPSGSYIQMDLRLGWNPSEVFNISIIGQNLLESNTQEYVDPALGTPVGQVQRGVFAKFTWTLP